MRSLKTFAAIALAALLSAQAFGQTLTEGQVQETMNNAFALSKAKQYDEAAVAFRSVREATSLKRNADERTLFGISSLMLSTCCYYSNQFDEGYRVAKALLPDVPEGVDRGTVVQYYELNGYCVALDLMKGESRRYDEARQLLEELLPLADADMQERIAKRLPMAWYMQGSTLDIGLSDNEALECFLKAAEGFREIGDKEDELSALVRIASIKRSQNDFGGALEAYRQGATLASATGSAEKLLELLGGMKDVYSSLCSAEGMAAVEQRIDSVARANPGNASLQYAYNKRKGDEARGQGQLQLAELWYRRNDALAVEANMEGVQTIALRDLYQQMGRYDLALRYAEEDVRQMEGVSLEKPTAMALAYSDVAYIYRQMGDSLNCFKTLDKMFGYLNEIDEPRTQHVLYDARGLAYAYYKNYDAALRDYQKGDAIMATKYGEDDSDRITLLALMGGVQGKLGHYAEARELYAKYAQRQKEAYGESSISYVCALYYLANAEALAGDLEQGSRDYETVIALLRSVVKSQLPYTTPQEREALWANFTDMLTNMPPFALEMGATNDSFTRSCYDALVLLKAFLLETERTAYDIIKRSGTEADLEAFQEAAALESRIKDLQKSYSDNAEEILTLSQELEQKNKALAARCRAYGDITSPMDVDYSTVRQALQEGDVLIDFTDYVSESKGRKYAAFVVSAGQTNPQLLPLFAEAQIDLLGARKPDNYYLEPIASSLRQLLWQPLEPYATEGKTVYYVPSQLLFNVALEAIPLEDGTILGDHYNFVRLSSAREVARYGQSLAMTRGGERAVLYGGLQYDVDAQEMAREAAKYDLSPLLAMRGAAGGGTKPFEDLSGTKAEIEEVGRILTEGSVTVTTYSGTDGTAESFLSLDGQAPAILHLATHGFYYTPQAAQSVDYLKGQTDAMRLSGLVFSGGNAAWLGKELPEGVLGGILTADDISRLDLQGAELVVLSACQTGQGEATSEGLYGLQRAFKKAGARAMVMTLWSVSDQVTREFMAAFHRQLTADGTWDKRRAFEAARALVRQKYPEPFYWAPFVMLD